MECNGDICGVQWGYLWSSVGIPVEVNGIPVEYNCDTCGVQWGYLWSTMGIADRMRIRVRRRERGASLVNYEHFYMN